jgi:hypothetical protein
MSTLTVFALVAAVIYVGLCVVYPNVTCRACRGTGKARQPGQRTAWRSCWWCGGEGSRTRLGRRLLSRRK